MPSKPKHHIDGTPGEKTQRNFTDPESRILKTRDSYLQGYNAQPPSMKSVRSSSRPRSTPPRTTRRSSTRCWRRSVSNTADRHARSRPITDTSPKPTFSRAVDDTSSRTSPQDGCVTRMASPPDHGTRQTDLASRPWRPSSAEQAAAAASVAQAARRTCVRSDQGCARILRGSCSAASRRYAVSGGSSPPRTTCGSCSRPPCNGRPKPRLRDA